MNKLKTIMTLAFVTLLGYLNAQNNPSYYTDSQSQVGNITTSTSLSVAINKPIASGLRENPYSAKLYVELAFEDDYITTGEQFTYQLILDVTIANQATTQHTLVISEQNPKAMLVLDVLPNVASLPAGSIVVNVPNILGNPSLTTTGSITPNYIQRKLQLEASLVREYKVDVRNTAGVLTNEPVATQVMFPGAGRRANFTWSTPAGVTAYPNYELQILKLENTDLLSQNSSTQIKTKIDWSRALRVETQSSATGIDITIAEGTGFYIWRVRPIGNYFEGGIANSENYGKWSNSFPDGAIPTILMSAIGGANASSYGYTFYFTDPDENINWIYNRVFTEANKEGNNGVKSSEGMSYADGLLRARQTQAYNSSNNTTLVTQTISDYSGRPALTTLPVPVDGDLENYKVGFVQNGNGDVYTALDYDKGVVINDPTKIENTSFDYYNGNNIDKVADAEGYPFKRTIFKTDGTGRVDEESGVGKMHALGSQGDGGGKTTRILFGSASDNELIRIFGEEAPLAESVIKTITIDPNDVISVTYTSKEGKTIATALITESTNNLDQLNTPLIPLTVLNVANQNVLSNQKFISSKRIAIELEDKIITLGYQVLDGVTMPDCPGGNCNLKVRFYLTDLKTGETYVSDDPSNSILGDAFVLPGATLNFPAGWSWIGRNAMGDPVPSTLFAIFGSANNQFTLTKGEYIITKEVFSGNEPDFSESYAVQYGAGVQKVIEAIGAKMQEITNAAGYTAFEGFIANLKTLVDAYQLLNDPTPANSVALVNHLGLIVDANYIFPIEFSFPTSNSTGVPITNPLNPDPINPEQDVLSFGLSCCGSIDIPVPKPEICVPCEAEGKIDEMREVDLTQPEMDYFLDANGGHLAPWTLVSVIVQDYFINALVDKLDEEGFGAAGLARFAPGFSFGSLNEMLTNMLVSRYYTGQSKYNSVDQKYYRAKENDFGWLFFIDDNNEFISNGVANINTRADYDNFTETGVGSEVTGINDNDEFNYDCKKLYECWIQAVNLINSFEFNSNTNVMNSANDEEGANTSEDHYDDDESGDGPGGIIGWLSEWIISEKMRDFQENEAEIPPSRLESMVSLPNLFMDCIGYQFAGIIDEDASVVEYNNTPPPSSLPILFTYDINTGVFNYSPNPCNGESEGNVSVGQLYYPYITKPEWMFKYFRYNAYDGYLQGGTSYPDDDVLLVNQFDIEVAACYNNAYAGCTNTNLSPCFGEECRYFHNSWSSGQRLNFYKQIRGGKKCPPLNPEQLVPADLPIYTKEQLIGFANDELDQAEAICQSQSGSIKSALIKELLDKCYVFVECKTSELPTYEISEAQLDNMVEAVVASCVAQVKEIRDELPVVDDGTTLCEVNPLADEPVLNYGCNLDINVESNSDFPYYYIQQCNWINEEGQCLQDDKISMHLFPECHRALLTQITEWSFEPNIPPATAECPNQNDKEWVVGCTVNSCGNTQTCTHTEGSTTITNTYSTKYTVVSTTTTP